MNAVIIEDVKLVAKELAFKIGGIDPTIRIVETLPSVKTAINWFGHHEEPDLVFADIELADGMSFDIFKRFQLNCPVIFVTAYNEYAIQAFKANGIDYLLKPVEPADLKVAIDKARMLYKSKTSLPIDMQQLLAAFQQPGLGFKPAYKETFMGNARAGWTPVKVTDIAYFQYDSINFMVTQANERYPVDYETLEQIEDVLDPTRFFRANRQLIISCDTVQSVKSVENDKLVVRLRPPHHTLDVQISRHKAPAFKRWLNR